MEHQARIFVKSRFKKIQGSKKNQRGTWIDRFTPFHNTRVDLVGRTGYIARVWFVRDLQVEKDKDKVWRRVAGLSQDWTDRKVYLKGRAKVATSNAPTPLYITVWSS